MSLIELKNYIEQQQRVNLPQLMIAFDENREVLEDMLKILIKKNKICCKTMKPACGKSCQQCDIGSVTFYEPIRPLILREFKVSVGKT